MGHAGQPVLNEILKSLLKVGCKISPGVDITLSDALNTLASLRMINYTTIFNQFVKKLSGSYGKPG